MPEKVGEKWEVNWLTTENHVWRFLYCARLRYFLFKHFGYFHSWCDAADSNVHFRNIFSDIYIPSYREFCQCVQFICSNAKHSLAIIQDKKKWAEGEKQRRGSIEHDVIPYKKGGFTSVPKHNVFPKSRTKTDLYPVAEVTKWSIKLPFSSLASSALWWSKHLQHRSWNDPQVCKSTSQIIWTCNLRIWEVFFIILSLINKLGCMKADPCVKVARE